MNAVSFNPEAAKHPPDRWGVERASQAGARFFFQDCASRTWSWPGPSTSKPIDVRLTVFELTNVVPARQVEMEKRRRPRPDPLPPEPEFARLATAQYAPRVR